MVQLHIISYKSQCISVNSQFLAHPVTLDTVQSTRIDIWERFNVKGYPVYFTKIVAFSRPTMIFQLNGGAVKIWTIQILVKSCYYLLRQPC